MRLLIDNALSPQVAANLAEKGYDVVHVRDIGMQAAKDEEILERAGSDDRIIVSADTDFGTLLALRMADNPSFVLLRCSVHRPKVQMTILAANLPVVADALDEGAIVVIEDDRVRIRRLPIGKDTER
jgi:predicted nuclease of predicted toxin-antitoxin system